MPLPPEPGIACLVGIAPWKRKRVRAVFGLGREVPLVRSTAEALRLAGQRGGAIAGWASRLPAGLPEAAAREGTNLWRIEDGFIRSAGLGAALVQPCSLVLDRRGIYYDPARPSDLEDLLQNRAFTPAELERAARLIGRLRERGVTKYNLAGTAPDLPAGRRVVLVLGQVDDDLSVELGGGGASVAEMIETVRREEQDACIVFKPHPDVSAGLRRGAAAPGDWIDAATMDLNALFARADRVHTLTSLGGFEALLRGRDVVVHGAPFYAGWGLTQDRRAPPRRQRRLTLAELVAGALIAYPRYYHPARECCCEVEDLLDWIDAQGRAAPPGIWRGGIAAMSRILGQGLPK
jgi:capsular polysaccharide export protein